MSATEDDLEDGDEIGDSFVSASRLRSKTRDTQEEEDSDDDDAENYATEQFMAAQKKLNNMMATVSLSRPVCLRANQTERSTRHDLEAEAALKADS
eukprot:179699-Rhodomonas_salina.3